MSFAKIYSAQTSLLKPQIIDVEVDLSKGLHAFNIVGLPDKATEEARDRIGAAIKNSGFKSPKNKNQKVVISLAPAELKKEGSGFDVAMALGYLLATGDIKFDPEKKLFLGELSLDGDIRSVRGILLITKKAKELEFDEIYVPEANAAEAALIAGIKVYGVKNLAQLTAHLADSKVTTQRKIPTQPQTEVTNETTDHDLGFADVKGNSTAKRGLEIAAAGGHNLAMYGPPGTGKTMLAKSFAAILPQMSFDEMLETTAIHSVAGVLNGPLLTSAPFRAPHHTASYVSLVGGGTTPRPGEITLAHNGVLFLDEFPEFETRVIEGLRQPLEDGEVSVSRAKGTAKFPARFILIAALNPCPCGFFGVKGRDCVCTPTQLVKYKRKLSGPIIDRIDLWVEVATVEHDKLMDKKPSGQSSTVIKEKIEAARARARERFKKQKRQISANAHMNARDLIELIELGEKEKELINESAKRFNLSARGYHKLIKVAQTIADLEGSEKIKSEHILEALQYRPKSQEM